MGCKKRKVRDSAVDTADNTCIDLQIEEPCQQGRLIHFIALRILHQTRNLLPVRGNLLSNVFSSIGLAGCGHFALAVTEGNPACEGCALTLKAVCENCR